MNQAIVTNRILTTQSDIRVDIDWQLLLDQRQAVLQHTDMPGYLLLPEIHHLLDAIDKDNFLLLVNTLWHTGARISECLSLTPGHFTLDSQQPYVSIHTLKKRGRPGKRGGGMKPRLVPISDELYIRQLQRYFSTHTIKKNERLFPVTRSAVNKRLDRVTGKMQHKPSIKVTPHVFRHSFAVNAVFFGTPLTVIQGWLGHADINNTLIYTQVLSLETYHLMKRIDF